MGIVPAIHGASRVVPPEVVPKSFGALEKSMQLHSLQTAVEFAVKLPGAALFRGFSFFKFILLLLSVKQFEGK